MSGCMNKIPTQGQKKALNGASCNCGPPDLAQKLPNATAVESSPVEWFFDISFDISLTRSRSTSSRPLVWPVVQTWLRKYSLPECWKTSSACADGVSMNV